MKLKVRVTYELEYEPEGEVDIAEELDWWKSEHHTISWQGKMTAIGVTPT